MAPFLTRLFGLWKDFDWINAVLPLKSNQPRAQSIRKGAYEMNAVFTGLVDELVAVLTKDKCGIASPGYPCATLAVHGGSAAGGHLLMRRDFGCYSQTDK